MENRQNLKTKSAWNNLPIAYKKLHNKGEINHAEYLTLLVLRSGADPYGVASTTLESLSYEVFGNKKDKSYINRVLLSLKRQKFIWYKPRQGRSGSFGIWLDDFIKQDKQVTDLSLHFGSNHSEAAPQVVKNIQNLDDHHNPINIADLPPADKSKFRSSHTHTETQTQKNNIDDKKIKIIFTESFKPSNSGELIILEIAKAVKETNMSFLLSVLRKYGLEVIQRAYGQFREASPIKPIENPAAYLNAIITNLILTL